MSLLRFFRRHRAVLLLMLIALLLRLWYLSINPLWPQFSNADDGDYFRRALRLAVTGEYIDDAWLIRPPFHVWIFAAWLRIALLLGRPPAFGVQLIQGFQTALGVLMVPLCYALARRLFAGSARPHRAGLLFAGFWAVWFPFVELPATLFTEPIYLLLFTLHLWLLLRWSDRGAWRDLILSGLVLGMAALTRSPALYALVFAVPWLILRALAPRPQPADDRSRLAGDSASAERAPSIGQRLRSVIRRPRAVLLPFVVLAACTLAIVLPWTARNWIVYHRVIPIDTLGPINLWLDLGEASERTVKIEQLRRLPQADRQAYATEQVRAILREDPLRPLRNVWPSFQHLWKGQYVEDFWVKHSFFTRPLREAAPLGLPGDLIWLVVVLAGVMGVLHPATDRPFKLLIGLWLLYSAATVLIFHVEPRYLLAIWLLLGLYAAWALSDPRGAVRALRGARWRAGLTAAAIVALLLLVVTYRSYPSIVARGVQREWYMLRGDRAYARGDWTAAESAYRAALAVDPAFLDGQTALALALGAQNRPDAGIAALTPESTRRNVLVEGLLQHAAGNDDRARDLLPTIENMAGEDAQRWALDQVPVQPRTTLALGDDGLDLGYIAGFGESENDGTRSYRWLLGDGLIELPLAAPLHVGDEVLIDLAAPLPLDGVVRVSLNGGPAVPLETAPGWRSYRLTIPPSLAGSTMLRVQLRAPTYLPMRSDPASQDPRALSVMVHSLTLRSASP